MRMAYFLKICHRYTYRTFKYKLNDASVIPTVQILMVPCWYCRWCWGKVYEDWKNIIHILWIAGYLKVVKLVFVIFVYVIE
jgi:hypothetical protein